MLIDELKKANIEAMKAKDNETRAVLSIVISRYKLLEVENRAKGKDIGDADLLSIIQKVLKELNDEKAGYIAVNNIDKANAISKQENVISSYLPKQLSEEEIKQIISNLEDKTLPNIMKYFKMNYAGQVDMSLVSKIARG